MMWIVCDSEGRIYGYYRAASSAAEAAAGASHSYPWRNIRVESLWRRDR